MANCNVYILALVSLILCQAVLLSQAQVPAAAPKLVTLPAVATANPPVQVVQAPSGPIDVSALAANLTANLNELGLTPADLTGKILPGLNAIQINSQIGQILATQIQAEAQQKYTNAVADTQQVLAALSNVVATSAMTPAAEAQLEIAELLSVNPNVLKEASATGNTTTAGRKLKL